MGPRTIGPNLGDPNSSKHPEPNPAADEALVARARGGDAAAFDALVVRHQDRVFNMALRLLNHREDALDVSQEIFLTVFKALHRFEGKARFSTWLYRVTVNRCRDELRRRGMVKHTRPQSLEARRDPDTERRADPPSADPAPPELAQARETGELVTAAIAGLPDEARETLVLRDVEGLRYEEIAEVLGIPVGTVRSRLNRARTLLRERLAPILEPGS